MTEKDRMDLANLTSVCSCCIPAVLSGVLLLAWVIFASASALVGTVSKKKGTRLHRLLSIIVYGLSAIIFLFASFLGILHVSGDLRSFFFAKLCAGLAGDVDMQEFRCNHIGHNMNGRVLEIGPGPGSNFKCWTDDSGITEWVGVEPNNYFEPFINEEKAARNLTFPTSITWVEGESCTIEPNSFDVVVATHVLCSVKDTDQVIDQIAKALKPGGTYYFVEHVKTREDFSAVWWMQQAISPVINIVGNGCLFKHTADNIAKFNEGGRGDFDVSIEYLQAPIKMPFMRPHIIGKVSKLR